MLRILGLIGSVVIFGVIGTLLGSATYDLEYLARQTAVLSFLAFLIIGTHTVYQRGGLLCTAIVALGIAQGVLYFFSEVDTAILSIMYDVAFILVLIYIHKGGKAYVSW